MFWFFECVQYGGAQHNMRQEQRVYMGHGAHAPSNVSRQRQVFHVSQVHPHMRHVAIWGHGVVWPDWN